MALNFPVLRDIGAALISYLNATAIHLVRDCILKCNHCGEIFGDRLAAFAHRADNPLKAKCLYPNSMWNKGMWKSYGIWWGPKLYGKP